MSIAITLPNEPLAANRTLKNLDGQVCADVVLHVAKLAVGHVAKQAGQLL